MLSLVLDQPLTYADIKNILLLAGAICKKKYFSCSVSKKIQHRCSDVTIKS